MSVNSLNRFIGNAIISDRIREMAMSEHLAEVLRENEIEEPEIAEIIAAQPSSLVELCAIVEQMVATHEVRARTQAMLPTPGLLFGLPVTRPANT